MDAGDLVRAIRRERRLSQRALARVAGVAPSTIDRIEAGAVRAPRLQVVQQILLGAGYELVVVNAFGWPLVLEDGRLRPCDRGGRRFPVHHELRQVRTMADPWWGWHRVAFYDNDPNRADWTFDKGPAHLFPEEVAAQWNDAT